VCSGGEDLDQQENAFIRQHGIGEYAKWYLGIDDQEDPDNKGRYKFPYSDFDKVHRCGLLAAESRAGQRKYYDAELAVAHLHGMLEALRLTADHSTRRIRGHQTSQS
jgi:hypothetical protein